MKTTPTLSSRPSRPRRLVLAALAAFAVAAPLTGCIQPPATFAPPYGDQFTVEIGNVPAKGQGDNPNRRVVAADVYVNVNTPDRFDASKNKVEQVKLSVSQDPREKRKWYAKGKLSSNVCMQVRRPGTAAQYLWARAEIVVVWSDGTKESALKEVATGVRCARFSRSPGLEGQPETA